jgi:hypothetical protein
MSVFVMHFSSHPLQRAAPRAGALQGGRLAYAFACTPHSTPLLPEYGAVTFWFHKFR